MVENRNEWKTFLEHPSPEAAVPSDFCVATSTDHMEEGLLQAFSESDREMHRDAKMAIRQALIVKSLRPDRTPMALAKIVDVVLGRGFREVSEVTQEDLHSVVTQQLPATVPILLVSSPGFDPSAKVHWAAQKQRQPITSIAMGSEEGYAVAEKSIASAARQGTWVLLKNVHLASTWLQDLEKKLFRMHVHDNFRIFLTMEFSSKVISSAAALPRAVSPIKPPSRTVEIGV